MPYVPPAQRFQDPLFRAMDAQLYNLGRLGSGETLDGTDRMGGPKVLTCPAPEILRLFDVPPRMLSNTEYTRSVCIYPFLDDEDDRIAQRKDRLYVYTIQLAVRMTNAEQIADAANNCEDNSLALRMDNLLHDVKLLLDDKPLLPTEECPNGLLDFMRYTVMYDFKRGGSGSGQSWAYPQAAVLVKVFGQLSEY